MHCGALVVEAGDQLIRGDDVGIVVTDRAPGGLAPPTHVGEHPTTDDPPSRPVVDTVVCVVDTTEVTGAGRVLAHRVVADVSEAVPLARRLRVPPVEHVVVARADVVAGDLVPERAAGEQRRIGQPHRPVERERRAPLDQARRGDRPLGREQIETAEHVAFRLPDLPRATADPNVAADRRTRGGGRAPVGSSPHFSMSRNTRTT